MKRILVFLSLFIPCAVMAGVGSIDDRKDVSSKWSSPEYNKIVRFERKVGDSRFLCTAQYVGKDIILTARHCVTGDTNQSTANGKYIIKTYDNRETAVVLEKYGDNLKTDDWALLRVTSSDFYRDDYFGVADATVAGTVQNAGFGSLRIFDDDTLMEIKAIWEEVVEQYNDLDQGDFWGIARRALDKLIEKNIVLGDPERSLKAHKPCEITSDIRDKEIIKIDLKANFRATCDTMEGNSGGPYFWDNVLYGIVSCGYTTFDDKTNRGYGVRNERFITALNEMRKSTPITPKADNKTIDLSVTDERPVSEEIAVSSGEKTQNERKDLLLPINEPTIELPLAKVLPEKRKGLVLKSSRAVNQNIENQEIEALPSEISVIEEIVLSENEKKSIEIKIETEAQQLGQELVDIKKMSGKKFLRFLERVVDLEELRKNYEEALARERSLPNRALGAAAIGATGIGGMMLASALSEQRIDALTEQEMQAYLKTFTCEYGGNRVAGGETNVELAGGNDMISLYTEYATLANDLKTRKELLGIAPGIESEVVIDKAETGLYDDAGVGITSGVYASIARAIMNPDGEDAAKWNEQRAKTEQRVKTGAAVAGAGAIGGAVGNILINHTNKDKTTDEESETDKSDDDKNDAI